MEFRLLGPLEAWHAGDRVDLGDLQQRHALAVLLLHANKPVATDRLIDILWGDHPPRTNLVTGYIAKIRKAFREAGAEDVAISTTPTGYLLEVGEDQLDTARFTRLCRDAEEATQAGETARATAALRAAVALWRGPFLEDLDIDRIGGVAVTSLDDAFLDALGDLAELELAAGNQRWVRDRLRPVVLSDPSRQRLAILLTRALLANGDRVQALDICHRVRDTLDDYGVAISAELRSLARLARYGEPRSTLPARPARFTGRAEELAAIESFARQAVEGDRPGVVWLSGMPGVGKTALAIQAAHALRGEFSDSRLFVALGGFTPNVEPVTPAEALGALLRDLGIPDEQIPSTARARAALYQDTLADTHTLVVLDNARCEEQIRELVPEAPGCVAIVTSRKVGDLEIADHVRVDPLPAGQAARLFRDLVGAQRLRGGAKEVEDVVARCGRIPLSITVVAAQFRRHDRWPLAHLLRALDEAGLWSADTGFNRDGVAGCLVSYQQLDESQRALFRLCGLVPGQDLGPPGAAALAGCDQSRARALLDHLLGVSLLEEVKPDRYRMPDPLREFVSSVLAPMDPDELTGAMDRLLDHYLITTSAAVGTAFPFDRHQQPQVDRPGPGFADREAALEWLATERTNLVAAIRFAAGHDRPEHTWRLAVLLWRYFYTTGHLQDWIETLELAKRTTMADPGNQYGQAHVLLRLSGARWRSGELAHALELAAQALPRWQELGDTRGAADALCAIASASMDLGRHDQAIAHYEAALAKYQEIDDKRGQANALSILGHLGELRGEPELAERRQVTAVGLLREIGHTQGLAHALDNLGSARQRLGLLREAFVNHEEARALAVGVGDRACEAYALSNLGNVHRLAGRVDDAVACQELARTVANLVGDPNVRLQLALDRGATSRAGGDHRAALREYRAALRLAAGTGDRVRQAHASHGIARALHALDEHERAVEHWRTAQAEFGELGLPEAGEIAGERSALPACACRTG